MLYVVVDVDMHERVDVYVDEDVNTCMCRSRCRVYEKFKYTMWLRQWHWLGYLCLCGSVCVLVCVFVAVASLVLCLCAGVRLCAP